MGQITAQNLIHFHLCSHMWVNMTYTKLWKPGGHIDHYKQIIIIIIIIIIFIITECTFSI